MRKPKPNWFETLVRARRILRARPPESRTSSTSRITESGRALTLPVRSGHSANCEPHLNCWPIEHCANEPEPFLFQPARGRAPRGLIALLLYLSPAPTFSAFHQVQSIGLTVCNLEQVAQFFTQVLSFGQISHFEFD